MFLKKGYRSLSINRSFMASALRVLAMVALVGMGTAEAKRALEWV